MAIEGVKLKWVKRGKVWELQRVYQTPEIEAGWPLFRTLGRLRRVKNKLSCKKFILERYVAYDWEYVTLLVMKLEEAQLVARTVLCAGGHDA